MTLTPEQKAALTDGEKLVLGDAQTVIDDQDAKDLFPGSYEIATNTVVMCQSLAEARIENQALEVFKEQATIALRNLKAQAITSGMFVANIENALLEVSHKS